MVFRRATLWLFVALAGCAETHRGLGDVWSVDGAVVFDARLPDASRADALLLDAGRDASVDAFVPPDAWSPPELCNGVDEDDDSLVDEGAQADCRVAPGARESVCVGGVCLCREEGALAHAGAFADCNGDWRDGCETALDSPVSCGGCGVVCDAVSECTDTALGGLRCRPMGILDFSLSRRDGEISCVVGLDHRVLCRGPNAAHAISDAAEESATLDWTVLDVPASSGVRADLHVRADGTEVMTVCVITTDGDMVCRGGNDTGLLGYGDREPRAGNHRIALPEPVYRVEIRQGDAYAMFGTDTTAMTLWRWGGPDALAPRTWLGGVEYFALGNMPIATYAGPSEVRPGGAVIPHAATSSWGPHHDRLAGQPDDAPAWSEPQDFMDSTPAIACERDVCCFLNFLVVRCWSAATPWASDWPQPVGATVYLSSPSPVPGLFTRCFYDGACSDYDRHFRDGIRMAPLPDGGREFCIGRLLPPDNRYREAGITPAIWCADARLLSELPDIATVPLRPEPDRISADGRPARSRADWDAMCLDLTPNHWRCWGLHEGWGHPPVP